MNMMYRGNNLADLKKTAEDLLHLLSQEYTHKLRREINVLFSLLEKEQHKAYSAGDFEQLADIESILRIIAPANCSFLSCMWSSLNKTESHRCWDHAQYTPKSNECCASTVCSVCQEILCVS